MGVVVVTDSVCRSVPSPSKFWISTREHFDQPYLGVSTFRDCPDSSPKWAERVASPWPEVSLLVDLALCGLRAAAAVLSAVRLEAFTSLLLTAEPCTGSE